MIRKGIKLDIYVAECSETTVKRKFSALIFGEDFCKKAKKIWSNVLNGAEGTTYLY